jgi:hypothetical protein
MTWDPAPSLEHFEQIWRTWLPMMVAGTDMSLVVRLASSHEFLGMAGLHRINASEPEVGIWIKEAMHGYGFGREAVAAVVSFAARLGKQAVLYPVVEQTCEVGIWQNVSADMLSARVRFARQAVLNFPKSSIAFRPLIAKEPRQKSLSLLEPDAIRPEGEVSTKGTMR